jgi:hypothetical protein
MGVISIDIKCFDCEQYFVTTLDREEATWEARWDCPECGTEGNVRRVPSAPNVMRASYPMGVKRQGFSDLLEANDLHAEISGLPLAEREKVQGEIDRLEGRRPAPKKFK